MQNEEQLQSFASRMNQICDDMGLPRKGKGRQGVLAERFHVTQKGARKWLEGEAYPTTANLAQIAQWAGVSTDWLLTGREPKRAAKVGEPAPVYLSKRDSEFLAMLSRLPDSTRAAIELLAASAAQTQTDGGADYTARPV